MNFFRTDDQATLNSLLKAARETLDHYRDAIELVEESHEQLFRDIGQQRRIFIQRIENAVRASGDLPTMPDPDKEAGEMLIHHVAALLKSNYAADLMQQRIDGEKNLANLADEAKNIEPKMQDKNLPDEFAVHVAEAITRLQHAHAQLSTRET